MKKVADNQFLQLRGKVWTYYRRVPTDLVPALGRTFIKKSLGTPDIKEARRLRNIESSASTPCLPNWNGAVPMQKRRA